MDKNTNVWEAHNVASRVKIGDTLYVKSHSTHLRADVLPTSDTLAILMPCDEVVWLGSHEKDKRYHKVSFTVKNRRITVNPPLGTTVTGYVFGTNLSVRLPEMELKANPARKIDPVAYPSFGVGVKA